MFLITPHDRKFLSASVFFTRIVLLYLNIIPPQHYILCYISQIQTTWTTDSDLTFHPQASIQYLPSPNWNWLTCHCTISQELSTPSFMTHLNVHSRFAGLMTRPWEVIVSRYDQMMICILAKLTWLTSVYVCTWPLWAFTVLLCAGDCRSATLYHLAGRQLQEESWVASNFHFTVKTLCSWEQSKL